MIDSAQVAKAAKQAVLDEVFRPAIAYHEAAHAVISRREGIASAWVILREETGEHRWQGVPLDAIDIDALELPRDRHLVESVVRVLLAGNAAQFRAYPGSPHSDGHDLDEARVLLGPIVEIDQHFDPCADVERYLQALRNQVRSALAVEVMSDGLVKLFPGLMGTSR